jgi:hypothetical protein
MRELFRLMATLVIWVLFATIVGVTLTSSEGALARMRGGEVIIIVAILAIAASVITENIWKFANREQDQAARVAVGKTKRAGQDRVRRLIESLDDEEIYDLESLLLAREESPESRRPPKT